MCCRYALLKQHARSLASAAGAAPAAGVSLENRYNIAPGSDVAAVLAASGGRELAALRWGLVPAWARDDAGPLVNARAESLAARPAFRDAFRRRRCLVPASGFYEWRREGRARRPWLFRLWDEAPFFLAGLWEEMGRTGEGGPLRSCAIITTDANSVVAAVHHRMPVILAADAATAWLDSSLETEAELVPLLRPFPADLMVAAPVSSRMNSVAHDDPGCMQPIDGEEDGPMAGQLGLGL